MRHLPVKIDFKKRIATYIAASGRFDIVTVPTMRFLMIDGHGDPNTSEAYKDALATLYPVAYKLKFFSKSELDRDYTVMPLEALWWSENMDSFTAGRNKSQWDWTVMIMVPDWIEDEHVHAVRRALEGKGGAPALAALRCEPLEEGLSVQTLHIGAFDDEGPVLRAMHREFIPSRGLRMTGRHHEIYLSDPRRTAPARLRTILRQPVVPVNRHGPAS
ncbi:GyrI-like domain-containing protein [Arthrobacter sp. TMN-37]